MHTFICEYDIFLGKHRVQGEKNVIYREEHVGQWIVNVEKIYFFDVHPS